MLRDQSVKMGKQYDAPESKEHIQPFIDSFHLQKSLSELKVRSFIPAANIVLILARNLIQASTRPSTNSLRAS